MSPTQYTHVSVKRASHKRVTRSRAIEPYLNYSIQEAAKINSSCFTCILFPVIITAVLSFFSLIPNVHKRAGPCARPFPKPSCQSTEQGSKRFRDFQIKQH